MKGNRLAHAIAILLIVVFIFASCGLSESSMAASNSETKTYLISLDKEGLDWARMDDQAAIKLVNQLLEQGAPVHWALEKFQAGRQTYPAGTFYVQAPFQTRSGISCETLMAWLDWEGKKKGVYRIEQIPGWVKVKSKALILPRIALFYDQTTYENCLRHYQLFTGMGFKVTLATANDLLNGLDDPDSVLAHSNVFVLPGGAMHFYAFMSDEDRAKGIKNIQDFVMAGGGYIGVCAGASEALAQSPYPYLSLVDANYHSEWFIYDDPAAGDWDWRALIGPINLEITAPQNPVMFGYGSNAVRPGYGPLVKMYYYGGPAIFNEGSSVTVLARYNSPVTQITTEKVKDVWGSAASVTADYGDGKVVLFGPHPEWPGPCARMYAQALYYVASLPKSSTLEPVSTSKAAAGIDQAKVQAIVDTVAEAKPILENCTRIAAAMVNLRTGDHYNPIGLWYDESILAYCQDLYSQMNGLSRDALKFQYEYNKLNIMRASMANDSEAIQWIDTAQATIQQFFDYSANLPTDPHTITSTDWTGAGPFEPYPPEKEAKTFSDLLWSFQYVERDIRDYSYPFAQNYLNEFNEYNKLRAIYQRDPTEENKKAMDEKYLAITSYDPCGPLYKGMTTLRHPLDVMQYKIDTSLLNLMTRAQQTTEVLSVTEYALATKMGPWQYTWTMLGAFLTNPKGALLP